MDASELVPAEAGTFDLRVRTLLSFNERESLLSHKRPQSIVPEAVAEIERHAGLTSSEVRVLRLMERTPSKGYTAMELAAALGAVYIFGKFLVSRDLGHLVKLGKIRVLKEKDGTWYFVA